MIGFICKILFLDIDFIYLFFVIITSSAKIECFVVTSVYKWEVLLEIYSDANTFGLNSTNSKAVSNSNMAISWLDATFPELVQHAIEGGSSFLLKAHPYAFMDSSLLLQVTFLYIKVSFFLGLPCCSVRLCKYAYFVKIFGILSCFVICICCNFLGASA